MRIVTGVLFVLSSGLLNDGSTGKEHVHFRIHVPEIINHHIHTKTVFVHIHKPKKSKPKEEPTKTYHESHEDWSSWSNYGYQRDHDKQSGNDLSVKDQKEHKEDGVNKEVVQKSNPFLQEHRDSYMPVLQDKPEYLKGQQGDVMGYSYPPQYAVQEDVKETENNSIEPYMHIYEEGYHRGGESASGHTYSGDVNKFYEDKHEKGDHSTEEYNNESKEVKTGEKTHAGRYFVDDSEYQQNNGKYKAQKRASRRVFLLW